MVAEKIKERKLVEYLQSGGKLPERNDRCICGSGRKFKKCCEKLIH